MNTLFPLLAVLLTGCNSGDDKKKAEADPCAPAATDADRLPVVQVKEECTIDDLYEQVVTDGTGVIEFTKNYFTPATISSPGFTLLFRSLDGITATILPETNGDGDVNINPIFDLSGGELNIEGVNIDGLSYSEGIRFTDSTFSLTDVKISDVTAGIIPTDTDTSSAISLDNVQFDDVEGEAALRMNSGTLGIGNIAVTESESDEGISLISVAEDADVTVTGGIGLRDNVSNGAPFVDLATQSSIYSLVMHDNVANSSSLADVTVGVGGTYGDVANVIIFDNDYGASDAAVNLIGYGNLGLDHWVVDSLVNRNTSSSLIGLYPQTGGSVVVKNSIFAHNWYTTGALFFGLTEEDYSQGAVVYNDGYDNETTADLVALDPTNVNTDPDFSNSVDVNCKAYDYMLASGSAMIDAGNPSDRDADGSRTDIGAFGGEGQAVLENFLTWYCGL